MKLTFLVFGEMIPIHYQMTTQNSIAFVPNLFPVTIEA